MLAGQASSYDEVPYSDHCFPYTHPDHLAAVGTLFGMRVPPPDGCRVLELGCARGGNIIPMAMALPGAQLIGIDLSSRQIDDGRAVVERLGLNNLDLRVLSIMDVDGQLGTFDYIICHGVYSWVPETVRDRILAVCAGSLSASGIAYVSYNTYPGWHARGMVRELLAYHLRQADGAALDRVRQAREFLDDLVRVLPVQSSSYARILRTEGEFLRGVPNTYLYHEHLEETNQPVYFREFIDRARAHGLSFLAESRTPGLMDNLPPEAGEALARWAVDDDAIVREQYLDFLCNRTFRRSLLCHAGVQRNPAPSPDALRRLSVSTGVMPASTEPDIASNAAVEFRRPEKAGSVTTNNPLVKAALMALHEVRPRSLPFAELWARVASVLGQSLGGTADRESGPGVLAESLLRCVLSDLVDLHVQPARFASQPGDWPVASPLARLQAEEGGRVTNLRGRTVELDELDRLVLGRLDGTRDRSAVFQSLRGLVASGELTISGGDQAVQDPARIDEILQQVIEPTLKRLADLALLVD